MSETKHSTSGFRRITRRMPTVRVRLFGFVVVVLCGSLLLSWITHNTWDQLDRLQREHAAVRTESFYLGVTLRGGIRGLNEKLLQFGQSHDPNIRREFQQEAADLQRAMKVNRTQLAELAKLPLLKQVLVDDFDILDQIQTNYQHYLTLSDKLLAVSNVPPAVLSFEQRFDEVRQASSGLLALCNDLVQAQREDFSDFLAETQTTLVNHQRLLKLTLALFALMAGILAVVTYRGMIAPLRLGLTQSKTIIERQEKLASLGVLASGVAHEIRNPLTAIKFRLFSLKKALPTLSQNEDARIIADEINRLERIVRDFLRFARPSEPVLTSLPAGQILKDVLEFLRPQLQRSGIQIRLELESPVWVHADAQQLKQVLINLIQNAAEAIGRNGRITLRLREGVAELEGRSRPVAILAVSDTGQGIPPEIEARLFDPFFTTKEGGTGLGLAVSARIVEKHGGILRYETEENHGTTFEVVLPQVEHHATETVTH